MPRHLMMGTQRSVLTAAFVCAVLTGAARAQQPRHLPVFEGTYGAGLAEHARFGREFGARFAATIGARFNASATLSGALLPWVRSGAPAAREAYAGFLAAHEAAFPEFVAELRGLADGAGLPFDAVLVQNLREEFGDAYNRAAAEALDGGAPLPPITPRADHCSDVLLWPLDAHNEDSDAGDLGHAVLVRARVDGRSFWAFTYAGDLPSGAFGVALDAGIGFTLNYVHPEGASAPPPAPGVGGGWIGRGFVSRDLLRAESLDDALARAARADIASGHNYQLLQAAAPLDGAGGSGGRPARLLNLEVAPLGVSALAEFFEGDAAWFHANEYQASRPFSLHAGFSHPPDRVAQRAIFFGRFILFFG